MAVVIFGGLITSTLLNFTVTPAAAMLVGKKGILRLARIGGRAKDDEHMLEKESLEIEGDYAK